MPTWWLGLAFDLVASVGLGRGVLWEPQVSRARLGSDGAGLSGLRFLNGAGAKTEGSDPEDGDEGVEIDLDDEPRLLLDFLNARQRRDAKSLYQMLPGLTRRIKLWLLDFLTFLLDRELISYNMRVSDLEERVNEMFLNRVICWG